MDLSSRARQRGALERCPYCHDLIGEGEQAEGHLARVECPACRTQHHVACVQELGRCTVHGCEQPISSPVEQDERLSDSPAVRRIRQRLRERARQFVRSNTRNRRDQCLAALERARGAEAAGRLEEASVAYADYAAFGFAARQPEVQGDSELLTAVTLLPPIAARRLSRSLQSRHHAIALGQAKLLGLVLVAAFLALWLFLALTLGG